MESRRNENTVPPEKGSTFKVRIEGLSRKGDNAIAYIQAPEQFYGFVLFLPSEEASNAGQTVNAMITGIGRSGRVGFAEVVR